MNTNEVKAYSEVEKLNNEIEIGKSIVETSKKKYADEIGNNGTISRMRFTCLTQPKAYSIPRKNRKDKNKWLKIFVEKIKILLGI